MFAVERLIAGGGDVVTLHESLGEILRAFEYGTSLRRTDDGHILGTLIGFQIVVDALYQWIFRTYHHHVDVFSHHELLDDLEVVSFHGNVGATVAGTCITWCDVQFLTLLTLSDFPSQCVLTSATA